MKSPPPQRPGCWWYFLCTFFLGLLPAVGVAQNLTDVFGVTHADGKYYLTTTDFLDEGADQILATGSKVIKLYLTPNRYPWNSDWPKGISNLVQVAQTSYFQSVFSKPFHAYFLTAYSFGRDDHYWTDGITSQQAADETRQFYELSKYLFTTYKGTGKTFVLQHWEGDWALRRGSPKPYDTNYAPSPTAVQGMIQWLNARQAGIIKARTEAGPTDVHVYGATEANRVQDSIVGKPGVANSVLPYTTVDLVSYSCYDSLDTPGHLAKAVDFLAAHLPATAVFGQSPHSVYLGEFGFPDNGPSGVATLNQRMDAVSSIVHSKGLPWVVFWQIYDNEPVSTTLPLPLNGRTNDANLRGFWMIKPDGMPSMAWHRYHRLFATSDPERATTRAIKSGLSEVFGDDFNRANGKNLGVGWSQASQDGAVKAQLVHHRLRFDISGGRDVSWDSATLGLTNRSILGHGLHVGDYFEVTLRRVSGQGSLGVELLASDQSHIVGGQDGSSSPLQAWDGTAWVPIAFDDHGHQVGFDWNRAQTLGVRFDFADGWHAIFSYYLNGQYVGAWLENSADRVLDQIGVYVQPRTAGAAFEFYNLKVYSSQPALHR